MPPPERLSDFLSSINQVMDWLLIVTVILAGLYLIACGIRLTLLSGFRFYLTWGLITGGLYLVAALLELIQSDLSSCIIFIPILVTIGGSAWMDKQQRKAKKESPLAWEAWAKIHQRATFWQKLFLYPDDKRTK